MSAVYIFQLQVHCPQVSNLKLAFVGVKIQQMLQISCKSGPFPLESWLLDIYQHTTASRLENNGFNVLAQIQVLFIYLGRMIHTLALQVTKPIFRAEDEGIHIAKKAPEKDFSHFSCFNLIKETQYTIYNISGY